MAKVEEEKEEQKNVWHDYVSLDFSDNQRSFRKEKSKRRLKCQIHCIKNPVSNSASRYLKANTLTILYI